MRKAGVPISQLTARLGKSGVVRRSRQNGRPVRGAFFLLHFQLGSQNRGRSGGNGNRTGLGAAVAVKNFSGVSGSNDLRKGSQGRSDNVDTTHQFVGTAVGKYLVNHEG